MASQPAIKWITLTADGTTILGQRTNGRGTALVLANGDFGGGELFGGYLDELENFRPSTPGLSIQGAIEIPAGSGLTLAINLVGSAAASIGLGIIGDNMILEL